MLGFLTGTNFFPLIAAGQSRAEVGTPFLSRSQTGCVFPFCAPFDLTIILLSTTGL
jgi:hypothetical protein